MSLLSGPPVRLYCDSPTSTLQYHFGMFVRTDYALHPAPAILQPF